MTEPIIATKQTIEQVFDGAAAQYDRVGPNLFRQFGARLVELLDIAPGMRVLDVGTGNGAALLPAAQRVGEGGQVVGIDLSNEMLGQADRAVRAMGIANVQLGRMDAEALQFPDSSFDSVTCAFALFLFPSMETALREMHRVCKPGGKVGVSLWSKSPPPFDPAWKIFAEMVRKYNVEVRMPQRIAHAPQDIAAMLATSGWVEVKLIEETTELVYVNEADWWAFQLTNGSRAAIYRMDEAARKQFKEEYLSQLRPLFRADGLYLPAPVFYAVGRRQ